MSGDYLNKSGYSEGELDNKTIKLQGIEGSDCNDVYIKLDEGVYLQVDYDGGYGCTEVDLVRVMKYLHEHHNDIFNRVTNMEKDK